MIPVRVSYGHVRLHHNLVRAPTNTCPWSHHPPVRFGDAILPVFLLRQGKSCPFFAEISPLPLSAPKCTSYMPPTSQNVFLSLSLLLMSLVHCHSKNKNRHAENADFLSHCSALLTSLTPTTLPLSSLPILTPPDLTLPLSYTPIQSKTKYKHAKNVFFLSHCSILLTSLTPTNTPLPFLFILLPLFSLLSDTASELSHASQEQSYIHTKRGGGSPSGIPPQSLLPLGIPVGNGIHESPGVGIYALPLPG